MKYIGLLTMLLCGTFIIFSNEYEKNKPDYCHIFDERIASREMKILSSSYQSLEKQKLVVEDTYSHQKFALDAPLDSDYLPGAHLLLSGKVKRLEDGYYRDYLLNKGICGEIITNSQSGKVDLLEKPAFWKKYMFYVKNMMIHKTSESYKPDHAGLIMGLLIGEDFLFTDEADDLFKNLGISHIVAVSGSNFVLVLGLVTLPLRRFKKRLRLFMLIVFAFIYIYIVGIENLAAFRAFIFYLISTLQYMSGRKLSLRSFFVLGIFVILILSPRAYLDVGFQLSISAWLVVRLLLSDLLDSRILANIPEYLRVEFLSAGFGSLLLMPMNVLYFGDLNLTSPIYNLLLVPIFGLLNTLLVVIFPLIFFEPLTSIVNILLHELYGFANLLDSNTYVVPADQKIRYLAYSILSLYLIYILRKYRHGGITAVVSKYAY